ncbi:MAG: hypothetical protein PHU14_07100 [Methylovulum sp.]|nr:hypothetical protein [Methylovulum sp.]
MKSNGKFKTASLANFFFPGFLLITVLAIFVPFIPSLPNASLDPSWILGMNQALAQHFVFGKDIIYTCGPYASILTRAYHPATDNSMVFGSLYLGVCFWYALIFIGKKISFVWPLVLVLALAALTFPKELMLNMGRDTLFFLYPLIISLIAYRLTLPEDSKKGLEINKQTPLVMAILLSALGLLPLIKGSLLIICLAEMTLCVSILWFNKLKMLAFIVMIIPLASMVIFWICAGQPIIGLSYYLINIMPIISGYTEAMAIGPEAFQVKELVVFILSAVAILSVTVTTKNTTLFSRLFLFLSFTVFLFLAFKGGFVRHDATHALVCGIAILTAPLLLHFVLEHRHLNKVVVLSVISWLIIDQSYTPVLIENKIQNIAHVYTDAYIGLESRINNRQALPDAFYKKMAELKKESQFPILEGTTDIYSFDQSYLIASGNDWQPRPVFQSNSVYTQGLAQINVSHLLAEHAPDNIIFKIQPIDGRFPAQEDGLSWPVLLANYYPSQTINDHLFLKKRTSIIKPEKIEVFKKEYEFEADVVIPESLEPLFAEIEIKPTLLGRLIAILYKPLAHIKINVELENGAKQSYRVIPGVAKSGFIISPLINDAKEFSFFYANQGKLSNKKVRLINIYEKGIKSLFWNNKYTLTFSKVKLGGDL